jgi:hypothetical protein
LRADRHPPRYRHRRVSCDRCPLNDSFRAGAGRGDPSVHNGAEWWRRDRGRSVRSRAAWSDDDNSGGTRSRDRARR